MVTINTFKSDFPDIQRQVVETSLVMPRHEIEKIVLGLCEFSETGLVYYESSGKKITVYTSDELRQWLNSLCAGDVIAFNGEDLEVVDAKPVLICGTLCIRCSNDKSSDQYDCVELYKSGCGEVNNLFSDHQLSIIRDVMAEEIDRRKDTDAGHANELLKIIDDIQEHDGYPRFGDLEVFNKNVSGIWSEIRIEEDKE